MTLKVFVSAILLQIQVSFFLFSYLVQVTVYYASVGFCCGHHEVSSDFHLQGSLYCEVEFVPQSI